MKLNSLMQSAYFRRLFSFHYVCAFKDGWGGGGVVHIVALQATKTSPV